MFHHSNEFCPDKPAFIKEVYAVDDIETLRQIIIRKERERQSIANDLEVAARIGLVISETNEAIQLKVPHNNGYHGNGDSHFL